MPIAPQHEWSEDEQFVTLRVRAPGLVASRASVELTDAFAKVTLPPTYVLAVDLKGEVDPEASRAVFGEDGETGALTLYLRKRAPGVAWGALRAEGDRKDILARREASVNAAREAQAAAEAAKRSAAARRKKEDLKRQMDMEEARRREIDRRKEDELRRERERVMSAKETVQARASEEARPPPRRTRPDHHSLVEVASDDSDGEEDDEGDQALAGAQRTIKALDAPRPVPQPQLQHQRAQLDGLPPLGAPGGIDYGSDSDEGEGEGDVVKAAGDVRNAVEQLGLDPEPAPDAPPPPMRNTIRTTVDFVEKKAGPAGGFLPAREKGVELPDAKGANGLSAAEREPVFLKERGDDMFRAGNLPGAIAAYEQALDNFGNHDELQLKGALLANLAAACLKVGDSWQAAETASRGIESLAEVAQAEAEALQAHGTEAATEQGAAARSTLSRLYARRGAARANLASAGEQRSPEALKEALEAAAEDYREAIAHTASESTAEQLRAALEEVEAAMGPPPMPAELKARGDARMRRGDFGGATEAYTAAARGAMGGAGGAAAGDRDEALVCACLSNRAAAALQVGRWAACASDCASALCALAYGLPDGDDGVELLGGAALRSGGVAALGEAAAALSTRGSGAQAARLACRAAAALVHLKRYADARLAYDAAKQAAGEGSEQYEAIRADAAMLDRLEREAQCAA